jgi:CRP-like cAMP-binding protein
LVANGNAISGAPRRYVERDGVIFTQGDRSTQRMTIEQGVVRQCVYLHDGQRIVVNFALPGDSIGLDVDYHSVTAEAATAVILHRWPERHRDDVSAAEKALAAAIQRLNDAAVVRARPQARARVAAFLMDLSQRGLGLSFEFPVSRGDLADHLGLSVHTISRAMSDLETFGLIARSAHGGIALIDQGALRKIATERGSPLETSLSHFQPGVTH